MSHRNPTAWGESVESEDTALEHGCCRGGMSTKERHRRVRGKVRKNVNCGPVWGEESCPCTLQDKGEDPQIP